MWGLIRMMKLSQSFIECDRNCICQVQAAYVRIGHRNRQTSFPILSQKRFR